MLPLEVKILVISAGVVAKVEPPEVIATASGVARVEST